MMGDLQDKKIAIVGLGRMGELLLQRLLTSGTCSKEQIIACEHNLERPKKIRAQHGVTTTADNRRAAEAHIIILAVPLHPPVLAAC